MAVSFGTRSLAVAALGFFSATLAAAEAPSNAELQRQIEELKQQIRVLTERLSRPGPESTAPALDDRVQAQDRKIEEQQAQIEALAKQAEENKKSDWLARTKIGGYGELHYNNLKGKGGASDKEEIDLHRFVMFFGHDFNERLRFRSELEVEHAFIKDNDNSCSDSNGDGVIQPSECSTSGTSAGEVEVEQAYVEYDIDPELSARAGLFLIPVGILNETHEPPTFYGVERNPVENAIVPTTWWAGGAGGTWRFGEGWALDGSIHEGLKIGSGSKFAVRNGRQKTASAVGEDLASTWRLKWTGLPGLELSATYQFQKDMDQNKTSVVGEGDLFETHAVFQRGPLGIRALYATWDIDGSGPAAIGADEQEGYYLEPSWRLNDQWGVFARYSEWDNQAGSNGPGNTEKAQSNVGFNYWPHQNVVLKADYQTQDNDDERDQEGFNLGVGYQF